MQQCSSETGHWHIVHASLAHAFYIYRTLTILFIIYEYIVNVNGMEMQEWWFYANIQLRKQALG
jgi:hypothetical protein